METKMRYVQQRVEKFILRTANTSIPQQRREWNAADRVSCVIVDLSHGGAAMLLPKNVPLPANDLRLFIPSPPAPLIGDISLTASVCWTDACYSIRRKKIGLHFMEYGDDEKVRLRSLIEWLSVHAHGALPCSLLL